MNNLMRNPPSQYSDSFMMKNTQKPMNNDIHHRSDQCYCQNCKLKINENQIMSICLNCSLSSQGTAYTLCSNCKNEQGKHHQKKGHCFALILNRKFKYPHLQRIGLLDRKISKNGVLVADQYCKDYQLFTKPMDSFNLEDIQIVQGKIVHKGVTCDGCECSIHGTRFCCLNCKDFDLCSNCMKNHIRRTTGSLLNVSTTSVVMTSSSTTTDDKIALNNLSFSHPCDHVFLQSALPITKRPKKIAESIYVEQFIDNFKHQISQENETSSNSIDIRPTEKTAEILIYPFSDQLFDPLYNIECSCFSKPLDKQYLYQVFKQSLCNNQEKPIDNFTWVACTKNNTLLGSLNVAGYITYNINKEKQRCEISSFAVHPNFRKNGIGQELLRFTIQHTLTYSWLWKSMNEDLASSQYSVGTTSYNLDESSATPYYVTSSCNEHVIVNVDKLADTEEEECKYWNNYPTMQSGYIQYWKKCDWIQLHVSSFNLPAQRLYTKFGFKATTFVDDYYHSEINIASSQQQASDQGDGVVMILSLINNQFIL